MGFKDNSRQLTNVATSHLLTHHSFSFALFARTDEWMATRPYAGPRNIYVCKITGMLRALWLLIFRFSNLKVAKPKYYWRWCDDVSQKVRACDWSLRFLRGSEFAIQSNWCENAVAWSEILIDKPSFQLLECFGVDLILSISCHLNRWKMVLGFSNIIIFS